MFYNMENLFDTQLDSLNKNKEYLPTAEKKWDDYKYHQKINQLAKVIASSCKDAPEFLGVCEIENEKVLQDLAQHPLLKKYNYEIVHFESRDIRGIDVGFLYKKNSLNLLSFKKVSLPHKKRPTRDILIVSGIEKNTKDTLTFLVNHWPSRFGGKSKSEAGRMLASKTLAQQIDSLNKRNPHGKIIAMGDFNDSPLDSSLIQLKNKHSLFNPFDTLNIQHHGTLKYKRKWEVYDQFLMNENLIKKDKAKGNKKPHLSFKQVKIHAESWMLEPDMKFGGEKPFRTYNGPIYQNGISDHLPILLELQIDSH